MADTHSRRAFLATTGTTASLALAGCSDATNDSESTASSDETTENSGDGEDGGDGGDSVSDDDTSTNTSNTTNTETETEKSWIENANNYSGIEDLTGQDGVLVKVGAGDAGFSFDPPAIRVSPGTNITWVWTGKGSLHNVVAEDGSFESMMTNNEDASFHKVFWEPQEVRYVCAPHQGAGMIGLVVVESE